MENNIKEERTKGFFIQAAKEIIKGEGILALNVRNIAERAAYSPATLYAYFKDLNNLIKECVYSFVDDLAKFITEQNIPVDNNFTKNYYKSFVRFFIQYPGIYQLLFIEANPILRNDKELIIKIKNIPIMIDDKYDFNQDNYFNQVNGLLFIYLNRSYPYSYQDFIKDFDKIF